MSCCSRSCEPSPRSGAPSAPLPQSTSPPSSTSPGKRPALRSPSETGFAKGRASSESVPSHWARTPPRAIGLDRLEYEPPSAHLHPHRRANREAHPTEPSARQAHERCRRWVSPWPRSLRTRTDRPIAHGEVKKVHKSASSQKPVKPPRAFLIGRQITTFRSSVNSSP